MAMTDCSGNTTDAAKFLLIGLQVVPQLKTVLFVIFFIFYLLTVSGNVLIIVTVYLQANLHSPMYLFLTNLSLLDVCAISNVMPTLLGGLLTKIHIISSSSCLTQYFLFSWIIIAECFLLTIMAYDRYVAICFPLHYTALMDQRHCIQLAAGSCVTSFLVVAFVHSLVSMLQFFGINTLDHFFCDLEPLLKVTCSDTTRIKVFVYLLTAGVALIPFVFIIISYLYIILAILKIASNDGRRAAFSTCSSHLVVVSMFFGSLIIMYEAPSMGFSLNSNKALSLLYTVGTPMTNPIIYALRNKAIMEASIKLLRKLL
ncbi:olfactory receptor 5A2-like [Pleurodeles waltl]|uniref:olfactory receptor 5A2-like n=1 Tax=Pleurodeles waltl TaxID=8319 RepID=UPI00370998EF